jgi:tetratricopeptide (TPR) repeat protein
VVHLAGGNKMAVRPINLRRALPVSADAGDKAIFFANKAIGTLSQIPDAQEAQEPQEPQQHLFTRADTFLNQGAEKDPASVRVHSLRGDAAKLRGQYTEQVRHMRRAVANSHCLLATDGCSHQNRHRMELAVALGCAGDVAGQLEVMRTVLEMEPESIFARLMFGQALLHRGDFEAAVPELMIALHMPNKAKPLWPKLDAEKLHMFREEARLVLSQAFSQRAAKLAAQGDHLQAIELLLERVLRLPGGNADTAAATHADLAKSYVALGELDKAEQALTTARGLPGLCTLNRAFVLSACGTCKEIEADAASACGAAVVTAALYQAAMAYYKQANAVAEDRCSRFCYECVQAKLHPDLEWVTFFGWTGGMGAGAARWTNGSMAKPPKFEQLPPGPTVPQSKPTAQKYWSW